MIKGVINSEFQWFYHISLGRELRATASAAANNMTPLARMPS